MLEFIVFINDIFMVWISNIDWFVFIVIGNINCIDIINCLDNIIIVIM